MSDVHTKLTVWERMHHLLSELWLGFVTYLTASISVEDKGQNKHKKSHCPKLQLSSPTTVNMCTRHTEWPINWGRCGISVLPLPKKPVGSIITTAMAKSGSHCCAQTLNFSNHVATLSNTKSQQKIDPVLLVLLQVIAQLSFKTYAIIMSGQLKTFRIKRNLLHTQQGWM